VPCRSRGIALRKLPNLDGAKFAIPAGWTCNLRDLRWRSRCSSGSSIIQKLKIGARSFFVSAAAAETLGNLEVPLMLQHRSRQWRRRFACRSLPSQV
jgi:hypothetical protein